VELRELRWAIVASQHRSLRQAAEALNIRQSTLSRCLHDLEYKLGATLFERTNGGTRPTIEGLEFLGSALHLIEETETIAARLKTRSRGESGRLTIGVHTSLSAGNLRATLVDHRRRFPDVQTYLVDGSSDHLISNLASSAIDVAFVMEDNPRWDDQSRAPQLAFGEDRSIVHQDRQGRSLSVGRARSMGSQKPSCLPTFTIAPSGGSGGVTVRDAAVNTEWSGRADKDTGSESVLQRDRGVS